MKAHDFILGLANKGLENSEKPILFLGTEEYWIQTGIETIKSLLFSDQENDFNIINLEFKNADEDMFIEALGNPPFFSTHRLVIMRDLTDLEVAHESIFLQSLQRTFPGVVVIIIAKEINRKKKFIKNLLSVVETIECPTMRVYEAKNWVRQKAKKLGLNLSSQEVDLLLEKKGTSLMALNNELEKLQTFIGEEKTPLLAEEWSLLLGEASETNIFQMLDRIIEGNLGLAINLLVQLLTVGEPEIKVLAMLGGEVRRLFMAWALLQQGRGEYIQKGLGCHPYVAEKLKNKAPRLSYQQLRQAHQRIMLADYRMKTGRADLRLELEMTLLDLCTIFKRK